MPVDFSDFSLNALRYAVEFATKLRASLIVVHVVPADYGWLGIGRKPSREYDQTLQAQAGERLRALAKMYIPKDAVADLEVRPQGLEQDFARDLADCTEFDQSEYQKRNIPVRFRDSIARLVSPLL